jgi:hypothetical protein
MMKVTHRVLAKTFWSHVDVREEEAGGGKKLHGENRHGISMLFTKL